jgi:hypothetical protein
MSIGLIFWVIMLIWLIFSISWNQGWLRTTYGPLGSSLLLFVLFLLLGWRVFGAPIHG